MANKDIDNEPMLEENSDEILLEETSGTEAMLEESSDNEVLLEETAESETVMLEETAKPQLAAKSKGRKLGYIIIIAIVVLYSIFLFIKSCQDEHESEVYPEKVTESNIDNKDESSSQEDRKREKFIAEIEANISEMEKQGLVEVGSFKIDSSLDINKLMVVYSEYVFSAYDALYHMDDVPDLIKVQKNNKYGFITNIGHLVVAPQYDNVYNMDAESGLMKVQKNSKYGFFNVRTFREVTPCIYSYISNLDGDLYKVQIDGKTGFLKKDGSVFKKPE